MMWEFGESENVKCCWFMRSRRFFQGDVLEVEGECLVCSGGMHRDK